VQGLEGLFLLVLLVASWRRLRNIPKLVRTNPYVAFALFYVLGFVWAFSAIGNFGILARQRVLMLPAFLVLLALPAVTVRLAQRDDRRAATAQPGEPISVGKARA
jgi:apolipoprotein N-acyltransferase